MLCIDGRQEELPQRLWKDIGRYRHKVFVNHLGWPLQCSGDVESDEFDGPNALYVASQDKHGQVTGVARLLPTTAPYLLEKLFPSLWKGELPHDSRTWELSRFAAVDCSSQASTQNQVSAPHAKKLLLKTMEVARTYGVTIQWRTATALWAATLFAGLPAVIGVGPALLAVWIPLIVGYQGSALLQFLTEHAWLRSEKAPQGKEDYAQRCWGRFLGERCPEPGLPLMRRMYAWSRWWARMLLVHAPVRMSCMLVIYQSTIGTIYVVSLAVILLDGLTPYTTDRRPLIPYLRIQWPSRWLAKSYGDCPAC